MPNFGSQTWQTNNQFSFLATEQNPQILFYATTTGGNTNIDWHLDDVVLNACPSPLGPNFTFSDLGSNTYQFNDATTGGTPVEWCWDFGDGNYSSLQNPVHTYAAIGPYTVCLNIVDANGCHDKKCHTIGDPCNCGTATQIIQGNTDWNTNRNVYNNLFIQSGAVLNVNGVTVNISPGCGIFVRNNALMNINSGSNLTTGCNTGRWNGITIFGNGNGTQTSADGTVIAQGSTIQRATTAVSCPNLFFSGGGLIQADATHFTNNTVGADIRSFSGINASSFTNGCTFSTGSIGVRLQRTEGVLISSSTFSNLTTAGVFGTDYTATIQGSTFSGQMPIGISVQNTAPNAQALSFLVEDCNFNNTGLSTVGLTASGVFQMNVLDNAFNTNNIGANLIGQSGFNVEDNNFNSGRFGLLLQQTLAGPFNNSECNTYGTVTRAGVGAWGNNIGYEFMHENFLAASQAQGDVVLSPIQGGSLGSVSVQGLPGDPVYNMFNDNRDIISAGQSYFQYFYPLQHAALFPALWPECDINDGAANCQLGATNNYDARGENVNEDDKDPDGCLNLPGIGQVAEDDEESLVKLPEPGETMPNPLRPDLPGLSGTAGERLLPGLSCETEACLPTIRAKIAELQGLVDDANTSGLLSAIAAAPTAASTRLSLLDASPYLSDGVLLALLAKPQMATATKAEVLLANAPVSAAVLDAAQPVVSSTTYQDLLDSRTNEGYSHMEHLQMVLSKLERMRHHAVGAWVAEHHQAGNIAAITATLTADASPLSQRRLVAAKLQYGEFNDAQALIDALPTATDSDVDFQYVQQINYERLKLEGFELSQQQEDDLYGIAYGPTPEAAYARALITALTGFVFEPETPEDVEERMKESESNGSTYAQSNIMVWPNPAKNELQIQLPADLRYGGIVRLYDLSGRLVHSTPISGRSTKMDIAGLADGIYMLAVQAGSVSHRSKVVVQH